METDSMPLNHTYLNGKFYVVYILSQEKKSQNIQMKVNGYAN